ncbi:hypothetical protein TNCT_675711 [Trichonephila clavata]|uniref:Uncharacterized protein n=1 Tax=Trichonephila clavata TaxID=2740835 RepID=A0A8X6HYB0_TRICU|nr:hypothetical protein TNCT_675711 [Trichonephila clavata]
MTPQQALTKRKQEFPSDLCLPHFFSSFVPTPLLQPLKRLSIPEALEEFHNLHSDIETDELSLSDADDIMSEKSSLSENTDIDEEIDDNKCTSTIPYI